jgi:formate dehydrogenase subunit delta
MDNDSLVRMANRIGDFFEAMPDRDRAMVDIADHMRKFWEPRMRRQMLEYVDLHQGSGLGEIVARAVTRHRPLLEEGLSRNRAGTAPPDGNRQ